MMPPALFFFLSRLPWLLGVFCGSMQILDLFVNYMDILTILIFPGHEYGISFHQSVVWQTPICPLHLWVCFFASSFPLNLCLFQLSSPVSSGDCRWECSQVFSRLLSSCTWAHEPLKKWSGHCYSHIHWNHVLKLQKIKTSQDCKTTKQNPFWGNPPWNIRGGKARLYALLALTFCRHLMLLRQQAGRKVESRALCSTSRRLSCLRMTKSRRAWTHSPNSCDDSLPEGEVFQCLWETERFPHLKSLIPETKNPFPLEAWWFLFCTFNSFQKVIGHDHFSPYLSLKRSHITIWREISKLVFLTILS